MGEREVIAGVVGDRQLNNVLLRHSGGVLLCLARQMAMTVM